MDTPHISASEVPIDPSFVGPLNPHGINLGDEYICGNYHSLPDIARVIKTVLMANKGQLLRESIAKASGWDDLWVTEIWISLETGGAIHTIFRLNCHATDAKGGGHTVALAVMVPKYRQGNAALEQDAQQIMEARKREALALGLEEESEKYESVASFPAIYGWSANHTQGGYYENMTVVIGKWYPNMGGLYVFGELKDKSNDIENPDVRRVYTVVNMQNTIDIDIQGMLSIIALQIAIAKRCSRVMTPVFGAADIMVEMERDRPMISTLRPDSDHENTYWRQFAELMPGAKEDPTVHIACQLLQLVTSVSQNQERHEELTKHRFFTYDLVDIFCVLREMKSKKLLLSKEDWHNVVSALEKIWASYAPVERMARNTTAMFAAKCKRVDDIIAIMDVLARLE